ncbi:Repeat domain-containing protein [Spirosomataceae bacterium TFI 002]|nr:Repeat domain-containing protein [Spirosomataceae bacterium TFI 002]
MKKCLYLLPIFLVILSCSNKEQVFELISSSESGVSFQNTVIENDSINILTFDYTYNGGGVALADFNNDGLNDIFFSANMSGNKLYINNGNFKFTDVSKKIGLEGFKQWCTAAIAVDINQDNLMDIYVPVSSTRNTIPEKRQNLLFVNKGLNQEGLPIFNEESKLYGVNDDGFSEGAAFFDFDNDGDLDLYVLTNVIDQNPNLIRPKLLDGSHPNTDRLYENMGKDATGIPQFKNISNQAGITIEGFGLGINIVDIDRDGWKDIYITNDYAADDLLYHNNGDGTFSDIAKKYFKHTSNSAMGNDIADINNDGLMDILSLDMMPAVNIRKKMFAPDNSTELYRRSDQYGYTYQHMRNTLQLNSGLGESFQEIGLLAGISETDWSWTPSLADFNIDGFRDLLVTNGFPKDVTDKDFMTYRANSEQVAGKEYLLTQIPQVKISNYAFKNTNGLQFEDVTDKWGLNIPSFSSGAAYADLDNDGDLDYVVNNTNQECFLYKNTTIEKAKENEKQFVRLQFDGNNQGIGVIVEADISDHNDFIWENNPYRGYKSTVEKVCQIGLGDKTLIPEVRVIWPNGKVNIFKNLTASRETIVVKQNDATDYNKDLVRSEKPLFTNDENFNWVHNERPFLDYNIQNLIPFKLSQQGPAMAVGDVNGDGIDDVFVGGAKYKKGIFLIQNKNGSFSKQDLLPAIDTTTKKSEDTGVLLFDADSDGDLDLYIVSGGNEDYPDSESFNDRLYQNEGGKFIDVSYELPKNVISGSCVRAGDIDNDGDLDLFVAGRLAPTAYPKATSSVILMNLSKGNKIHFSDVTRSICPELQNFGLISDAIWTDFNNDKKLDLISLGDFDSIHFFENNGKKLVKKEITGLEEYKGVWTSINGGDFDGDGDIDYIAGNLGENIRFKGTPKEPAILLSGDFDNNGIYDVIPFHYVLSGDGSPKKVMVPYNGKGDISKQLNVLRTRFVDFKSYATATINNVLTQEELAKATRHDFNYSSTSYIENLGNGQFKLRALPIEAQYAPINGIVVDDFNSDGSLDLLLTGNNFGNELVVGQYDAFNGLYLMGNGKGDFVVKKHSGFMVTGDAKSLVEIMGANNELKLISAQNNSAAKLFTSSIFGKVIIPKTNDRLLSYKLNGKVIRKELYWGSSYLSQSTRKQLIPEGASEVRLE